MRQSKFNSFWIGLAIIATLGFSLRYFLAFAFLPTGTNAYGFAWDLSTFADWMFTIRSSGFHAYEVDPSINYPPVFADILQGLNFLGDLFSGGNPSKAQQISIILLKLPAIIADIGVAVTLAVAGKKWFSPRVGLWAAGMTVLLPVFWYDSAVWGQVDSISALFMLVAVVFIADRKPEWSALFVVLAILTKPQGILVGLVIAPLFIGQLFGREYRWWRTVTVLATALGSFAILALPWNLNTYATGSGASIPLIGDILGLAGQYRSTAGLFQVLTANAYNPWALAGFYPLAPMFQNGTASWTPDSINQWGLPANLIGNLAFLAACGIVFWFLVRKPTVQNALTGFAVVLVAFYDLPTRVHERYLVQAFVILCLVWATKWWDRIALTVLSLANVINLHAILATGLNVQFPPSPPSTDMVYQHHGQSPDYYGISGISLAPGFSRDLWLVYLVIGLHFAALCYLFWQLFRQNLRKKAVQ